MQQNEHCVGSRAGIVCLLDPCVQVYLTLVKDAERLTREAQLRRPSPPEQRHGSEQVGHEHVADRVNVHDGVTVVQSRIQSIAVGVGRTGCGDGGQQPRIGANEHANGGRK